MSEAITTLGKEIAVLTGNIQTAKDIGAEYVRRQIERKEKELASLSEQEEERRSAEVEYAMLTAQFSDENQRKDRLIASVRQGWAEMSAGFHKRRGEIAEQFRLKLAQLESEKETARGKITAEHAASTEATKPRRAKLDRERAGLNEGYRALVEMTAPREIAETDARFRKVEREQMKESARTEQLRSELFAAREKAKAEIDKLEREAAAEKTRIETAIATLETECSGATTELEAFDASLAHFFQTQSPLSWPDAAKMLSRDALFQNAGELEAKVAPDAERSCEAGAVVAPG